jgi:hypothetical protein
MNNSTTTRRRFIVAAITFSGLASGVSVLQLSNAWAQSDGDLDSDTLDAMIRMARTLYPHDSIADEVYAEVLDGVLADTAAAASFAETLKAAEAALDGRQEAGFMELDQDAQIAALRAVEGEGFFAAIQASVRFGLYGHPAVWQLIGYEGPSYQDGGYLHRGAGEIDWLPEAD